MTSVYRQLQSIQKYAPEFDLSYSRFFSAWHLRKGEGLSSIDIEYRSGRFCVYIETWLEFRLDSWPEVVDLLMDKKII